MPVSGYDPDDLDDKLVELMADRDVSNWLTAEEQREYEQGANLVDLLDDEDIHDLLAGDDGDGPD
ncbi:hypothetical protein [Halorussus halophilus]|uniref:hypothetical protein n=1 Tax=Halorussus halophilus TaxID=2650975 RepID=UPI001300F3E9|nr:hypothetical protein [Halorussus halophilus]